MKKRELKLLKIEFGVFKHEGQSVQLDLGESNQQCTFISAQNGQGKTTIFNALAAFLNKDAQFFEKEKINNIKIEYEVITDGYSKIYYGNYLIDLKQRKIINGDVYSSESNKKIVDEIINNSRSIFVGGNRNVSSNSFQLNYNHIYDYLVKTDHILSRNSPANELYEVTDYINRLSNNSYNLGLDEIANQNHIYLDNVSPAFIEKSILDVFNSSSDQYTNGIIESMFEDTIYDYNFDSKNDYLSFLEVFESKIAFIKKIDKSKINSTEQINFYKAYLKNKSMYDRIPRFLSKVNSYLNRKKLAIKNDKIEIQFEDINDSHDLNRLSNGELNLIALFLATELLVTSKIDLLFIDEISTSLDTDWLEKLVDDIVENKNIGQVIIITHSPDVTDHYHNICVKKLKLLVNGVEV